VIRCRAKSGSDGLAGMSAIREMRGMRLVRPLLAVPKPRLVALLAAESQPFLSDPSNLNPAFERARLRLAHSNNATNIDAATAELRDFGRQRIAREQQLDRFLAALVSLHAAGFAVIDQAELATAETELIERALGRIAACIGGAPYPSRGERVKRLRGSLLDQPERARTLGGCRFVPWRGKLLVVRELSRAAAPVRLTSGTELLWDRRFAVAMPRDAAPGTWIGYLGQWRGEHHSGSPDARGRGDLPPLVDPMLPAFWNETGLLAVPHLGYFRAGATNPPRIAFHPVNPLSQTGFTVV